MDNLEEIRRRKIEEIQKKQQEQLEQHAQFQRKVEEIEQVVKQKFTKEALQRYGNLKTAHPEKAIQLLAVVMQLLQKYDIEKISDEQLKSLLQNLQQEKKEINIKHK